MELHPFVLAVALVIEAAAGYPDALYAQIRHPVVWIGALIAHLDRALNRESDGFDLRKAMGVLAVVVLLLVVGGVAAAVAWLCRHLPFGGLVEAALASSLIAQRSLYEHVAAVPAAFRSGGPNANGLEAAREAVSRIVGRNPATLDEHGVCRAAIESLSENFSDGVVAPAFWLLVGGLPGVALYKAVNTADSMIGHRTPRHEAFGWAAARLDDLVNLPGSRLTALLITLAARFTTGADAGEAWRSVRRDARRHRSPNAGWPEAAMAGALDLRLGGPRVYGSVRIEDAWMGPGRTAATPQDIDRALFLYRRACLALIVGALVLAVL